MKIIALRMHDMNADGLLTFSNEVHDKMVANASIFTAPPVSMTSFSADIGLLQTAQQATILGGKAATINRNEKRKAVEADLFALANYVEIVSKGDTEIILLAGMLPKRRGPRRYDNLGIPQGLKAQNGLSGQVRLRWKKVAYARNYAIEYCLDPMTGGVWHNGTYNTSAEATVMGLDTMKRYWFRVRAMGTESMKSEWSEPAMIVVV